ncbi:hypothetical protein D3C76_1406010 [compost metagenome]
MTVNKHLSTRREHQSCNEREERGFTASTRTNQTDQLTGMNIQIHPRQSQQHFPVRHIDKIHVFQFNDRLDISFNGGLV